MIFEHLRRRRSVTLLASGALRGSGAEAARRHLASCARCRAEHDEIAALFQDLAADPLRGAEPGLPLARLVDLVNTRIDRRLTRPRAIVGWRLLSLPVAAAAALAAAVLVPPLVERFRGPQGEAPHAVAGLEGEAPAVSDQAFARLERNVAREQAARYLSEAQDVLVNVAATPPHCRRARANEARVDLESESRRSRELLTRRALLVEGDEAAVMSAQPVLDDVSDMLRAVAELEPCSRPDELLRLQEAMEKRRLLMKMRLMERELLG